MERITLREVGLRDGLQAEERTLATEEKRRLIESLVHSGIRRFEVMSFVHLQAIPQLAAVGTLERRPASGGDRGRGGPQGGGTFEPQPVCALARQGALWEVKDLPLPRALRHLQGMVVQVAESKDGQEGVRACLEKRNSVLTRS